MVVLVAACNGGSNKSTTEVAVAVSRGGGASSL